jgi:hypothetical protein
MINVSNIISNHIQSLENVITLESLYQFNFNPVKVPVPIIFPIKKPYEANLALKTGLHNAWMQSPLSTKGDIIEYYIKNWGGIRGNNKNTMAQFRTQTTTQLLNSGYKGISSWSKALVIHNPESYFIYDSRVALTINWLQKKYNLPNNIKFEIPLSQSKSVSNAIKELKTNIKWNIWKNTIQPNETYAKYLELLDLISINTGYSKSKIEMILFSIAPNLADEIVYLS